VGTVSILADISAVLVIVEFILLAAIPLLVLYFIVKGVRWLNEHLRPWLQQMQAKVDQVRDAVKRGSQAVAKPFVAISVCAAQVQGLFRGITRGLSR